MLKKSQPSIQVDGCGRNNFSKKEGRGLVEREEKFENDDHIWTEKRDKKLRTNE